jgi:hypothetical protein
MGCSIILHTFLDFTELFYLSLQEAHTLQPLKNPWDFWRPEHFMFEGFLEKSRRKSPIFGR